jgi:hypothetical protein
MNDIGLPDSLISNECRKKCKKKNQTKGTSNSNIEIHDRLLSRSSTGTSINRSRLNYGTNRPLVVKSIIAQSVARWSL